MITPPLSLGFSILQEKFVTNNKLQPRECALSHHLRSWIGQFLSLQAHHAHKLLALEIIIGLTSDLKLGSAY